MSEIYDHSVMKMSLLRLLDFFKKAREYVISQGYQWEIDIVENRYLINITSRDLAWNFLFCALGSSGLNNKVVQKQYDKFVFEDNGGKTHLIQFPIQESEMLLNLYGHTKTKFFQVFKEKTPM